MLTAEYVKDAFQYDAQTGLLTWRVRPRSHFRSDRGWRTANSQNAGKVVKSGSSGDGYVRVCLDNKQYLAHRLAWLITHGEWPAGQIDHVNGKRSDNRLENLRDIPGEENQRNMRRFRSNTSGQVGVNFFKPANMWRAYINIEGKRSELGYFKEFDEAVAARKCAERRFGFHENHGRPA